MEILKKYILLGIISVLFVYGSLILIKNYAERDIVRKDESYIDSYIAEIKTANLEDYLLETPDVIIYFTDKQLEDDFIDDLVTMLANQHLLSETVYLEKDLLEVKDIEKIELLLAFNYQNFSKFDFLIFVRDFEVVEYFILEEKQVQTLNDLIIDQGYGND